MILYRISCVKGSDADGELYFRMNAPQPPFRLNKKLSNSQFWFTPLGWEKYGMKLYDQVNSVDPHNVKLLKERVNNRLLRSSYYQDEYQIAI